jgi:2-polyprenyl-3-methyl-5-hydroxy-6-metoxy-1,4-benzoquinol methylase
MLRIRLKELSLREINDRSKNMNDNYYLWDITKGYATKAGKYKHLIEKTFIERNIGNIFNGKNKILDIGGGSGRFAIPLSATHDVTIIEPNVNAIKLLKERSSGINILNGLFENYDFEGKTFDIILIIEVMENFKDLDNIFQKLNSILNPNGIIIFSNLNSSSWKNLIRRKILKRKKQVGMRKYLELIELINKNNLSIIDRTGFNWLPVKVCSNNIFVPFFAFLERYFLLKNIYKFSPEILYCVQKITSVPIQNSI